MASSHGPRVQVLPCLPAQVGRGPQCPVVYAASRPVSRPQLGHALGSAHAADDGFCRSGLVVWLLEPGVWKQACTALICGPISWPDCAAGLRRGLVLQ